MIGSGIVTSEKIKEADLTSLSKRWTEVTCDRAEPASRTNRDGTEPLKSNDLHVTDAVALGMSPPLLRKMLMI